jgi:hypothetical protein
MIYAVAAVGVLLLLAMSATAPRAFVVILTLAVLSLAAWYIFAPERKYENQAPPRVVAPTR